MSPHAWIYQPALQTRTPLWLRCWRAARTWLLALTVGLALLFALGLGAATLIARLQATEAQLERVHMQGLLVGMTMCEGR